MQDDLKTTSDNDIASMDLTESTTTLVPSSIVSCNSNGVATYALGICLPKTILTQNSISMAGVDFILKPESEKNKHRFVLQQPDNELIKVPVLKTIYNRAPYLIMGTNQPQGIIRIVRTGATGVVQMGERTNAKVYSTSSSYNCDILAHFTEGQEAEIIFPPDRNHDRPWKKLFTFSKDGFLIKPI